MDALVEAWLKDLSSPPPTPADLAAYAARQDGVSRFAGGGARAALLRLASYTMALFQILLEANEQNRKLWYAVKDASFTATAALERLQAQQPLVDAAVTWREAHDSQDPVPSIIKAGIAMREQAEAEITRRSKRA